jgi:hypothetical protein
LEGEAYPGDMLLFFDAGIGNEFGNGKMDSNTG